MPDNKKKQPTEPREGLGFNDARGDSYTQSAKVPKHNGLNVNNDPERRAQKDAEKEREKNPRRPEPPTDR